MVLEGGRGGCLVGVGDGGGDGWIRGRIRVVCFAFVLLLFLTVSEALDGGKLQ